MALSKEFLHHLHELMVEVSESVREEESAYKRELIFRAQKTNNSAAMAPAYSKAAIHAFQNRIEKTISRYFEAMSAWGIAIDDTTEKEMLTQINLLASGPRTIHLPPGVSRQVNAQAVQGSHASNKRI